VSEQTSKTVIVRELGLVPYEPIWQSMVEFTNERDESTADEFWLLEHERVFTQGQAGKAEHVLAPGDIPVVQVDRGGQVTYHGPGQLVCYLLLNIKRLGIGARELVSTIEQSIVELLQSYDLDAYPRSDAPGVYLPSKVFAVEAKVAQIGLRIRKGSSFHGLSLNVDMDLEPFQRINPCGYQGMAVTTMSLELDGVESNTVRTKLEALLFKNLSYNARFHKQDWD